MARYCALIEYDGTNYFGFQRQKSEFVTIQGEIERVISHLAQEQVVVTAAGRTDSGVHALGQVVSFKIEWQHSDADLRRALNANLPQDIVVLDLKTAASTFHPRYDARQRTYKYFVFNRAMRSPLRRYHSWHVRQNLQIDLMNEAAALLVGVHDFATFGVAPQGDNTVREVFRAYWQIENELLAFSITANAFLYRMVRSIVGTLVAVGLKQWQVSDFVAAFVACDRNRSAPAAPPQGLYLTAINYDD